MKDRKPTSPGRRFVVSNDYKELTPKVKPLKSLTVVKKRSDGRDNKGRISIRHRGGGNKKKYRLVDTHLSDIGDALKIISIEYDPNRTAHIARVQNQEKRNYYILAIAGVKVGDTIKIGEKVDPDIGNRLPLKNIPIGTNICNLELFPGRGGVIARSAGANVALTSIDSGMAQVTMGSGEIRLFKEDCMATIGSISNKNHHNVKIGKAGIKRHMGRRPYVRGSVMNPNDHPHGGGEGKSPVGILKGAKTPWGKLAHGVKTRKKKKYSNKYIVKGRKKR